MSLLFAVEKSFQNEDDKEAVVYFLNPSKLNLLHAQQEQIINISSFPDIHHDGPIVIQGRKLNPRVNAQKGLFVLFQDDDKPLELINNEDILKKLVIAGSETKKILSSLYSMGISFSHIYPELSSVAKDIVMQQDILDYIRENN